ncbi:hypothetical protein [Haliea atlantica]|nr:hypothetical protein [Haliea sp.]|tara:strand:- start:7032 stop:8051 length:1020 start_codon:yes stop_codon:yes gene_type:complete
MQKALTAALLAATTILSGCKIQMSTSPGGTITTQSGSFTCRPNTRCPTIDVNDIHFDETFVARPQAGYEFVGWKKRHRGMCGGNRKPCRLSTAGFAGNDDLMAFLERPNEVFYLEAVFRKKPQTGSGDARNCFNAALVTADTVIVARYRSTDASGATLTTNYEQRIQAGARFNGRNTFKGSSDTRVTGAAPSTSTTDAYFVPDVANYRVTQVGVEVASTSPVSSETRIVFKPQRLDRFDLSAGQSYSQNYTTEVTTRANGFNNTTNNATATKTTFIGVESVTVPAGSYQACKFQVETTDSGGNTLRNEWFGVGNGMLLKSTESGDTNVLISASINGGAI